MSNILPVSERERVEVFEKPGNHKVQKRRPPTDGFIARAHREVSNYLLTPASRVDHRLYQLGTEKEPLRSKEKTADL